ncbi:MAG: EAL domain-containing protein, partial [Ectothiorhodospiraceae bacterium]|nr:EAL domain-containing protein [Ectothiorhodospiraceae bacterium]
CDNLGLEVIAEGVEDRDQHDFLLSLGCLGFQGYLFSPPLEEPRFLEYLERHAVA